MNAFVHAGTAPATTPLPHVPVVDAAIPILAAIRLLLPRLEHGERIDAAGLGVAMETAFGASDAAGARDWKLAWPTLRSAGPRRCNA